jgi:hypothetical protein
VLDPLPEPKPFAQKTPDTTILRMARKSDPELEAPTRRDRFPFVSARKTHAETAVISRPHVDSNPLAFLLAWAAACAPAL